MNGNNKPNTIVIGISGMVGMVANNTMTSSQLTRQNKGKYYENFANPNHIVNFTSIGYSIYK
ncbi:MAG: hypothetical protein EBR02_03640 [Alphaproteobacteria bacterium]|nr:hypothetical protein [Alphaproteobacteria bacterium]